MSSVGDMISLGGGNSSAGFYFLMGEKSEKSYSLSILASSRLMLNGLPSIMLSSSSSFLICLSWCCYILDPFEMSLPLESFESL